MRARACRRARAGLDGRRSGVLERLAANLVSNAVRHNIVGGRIEVATRTESGRAHLTVANTGPLVPAGGARASLPAV